MKTVEWTLLRKYLQENYTIGKLFDEQDYICDTLEDKVRELHDLNHDGDFDEEGEGKIYGRTAIPCGRYRIKLTYSPKLKRTLPFLVDVPGYTGIRIHGGKNENWTEGCVLVGENKIKGGLINYKYWETVVIQRIQSHIKRKELIFITIKM